MPFVRAESVSMSCPPYREWTRLWDLPPRFPPGTVLRIPPEPDGGPDGDLSGMLGQIRRIRKMCPGATIAGAIRKGPTVHLRRLLARAGMRLWLPEGSGFDELHLAAAQAGLDQVDVESWLRTRFSPHGLRELALIQVAAHLTAGAGLPDRTLDEAGRWFPKLGLPTVGRWRRLGRTLPVLVALQGEPKATIEASCKTRGWPDPSSFSHAVSSLFGDPPSRVRETVGWEWLLNRFIQNARA